MKDYLKISLAALLTALAVNFFFIHDGLAPGGITGLALVTSSLFGFSVETMSLMISIPMLVIAVYLLGSSFGFKTLFITVLTPILMNLLPKIWLTQGLVAIHPLLELLVSAVLAGILIGTGIAIALNANCATGGTDVLALIIHQFAKGVKVSTLILCLDGIIIVSSGLITQNLWISLFSFISLLVIIKTIQKLTNPSEVN